MSSPSYRRGGDSSSSNYRGSYTSRGGGGGFQQRGQFRGGRGGYKPRRYWDNDDYYKRDREYDRGRDRHRRSRSDSRSRSRSHSRSYSRSRSQSPVRKGRSPRRSEEYKPDASADVVLTPTTGSAGPTVTYQPQAQYDPYEPQKDAKASGWTDPNEYVPQSQSQRTERTNGQQQSINSTNPYGTNSEAIQLQLQQFQKYQQQLQQQQSQPNFPSDVLNMAGSNSSASSNMYTYGSNSMAYPQQSNAMYQNQPQTTGISLDVAIGSSKSRRDEVVEAEKPKKKKDRKKKKRRRRSSSSSSSSSDDSSDSRSKRKSKKDSDDSSDTSSDEDKKKKDKGTSSLTTEQKEALAKQKEGYTVKMEILDREIKRLISQGDELRSTKADIRLVEENYNLQAELKGRRKAVQIVMEKINDVLRSAQPTRPSHPVPPPPPKISQSLPQVSHPAPPQVKKEDGVSNVEYYDNGVHWCRICNVFPETVVNLLDHFHSKEHQAQLQLMHISEKPWQKKTDKKEIKVAPGAKRIPFRGAQFLSPVEGWYCRLCSAWLGDHECAAIHLKGEEHNSGFLNFLAEHPDWETKWLTDRGKVLGSTNPDSSRRPKSRFDLESQSQSMDSAAVEEDGKSFRVTMRNTVKADESRATGSDLAMKPETASKDVSVEEWMSKPQKVKLDIIDTQKFAAIVRQKHGQKEKEELARASQPQPSKSFSPSAAPFNQRDTDPSKRDEYGSRDRRASDNTRRYDRVEMQFAGSRDRDRYGPHRGARRRSRSRSRSRSRDRDRDRPDRYNNRRRSRDRSRSRSRDRDRDRERDRERDRGERDKDKPDVKEQIRRLPMIGKMPLYKKPTISVTSSVGKEKEKISEYGTEISSSAKSAEKVLEKVSSVTTSSTNLGQHLQQQEESNMSAPSENSMTGFGTNYNAGLCFNDDGFSGSNLSGTGFSLDVSSPSVGDLPINISIPPVNTSFQPSAFEIKAPVVERDLKLPAEKEPTMGGTGLPDDLQQALDIIYSGGGKPITVPPPSIPTGVPPPSTNFGMTDFSAINAPPSFGNYMGYTPYPQNFDGYGPVSGGYDDLDDGPPGESASSAKEQIPTIAEEPQPAPKPQLQPEPQHAVKEAPPGDDEMDDLRMLGIDVDDVAVGGIR